MRAVELGIALIVKYWPAHVSRVLIVEDDADLRRMFRMALMLAGYDAVEAADGIEALRVLDVETPDAVVLDLGLPVLSGQDVRQEMAAHSHTRLMPVIVVTGQPGDHDDLDVACLLRKPVTPERLVVALQAVVSANGNGHLAMS